MDKTISTIAQLFHTHKCESEILNVSLPLFTIKYLEGQLNDVATLANVMQRAELDQGLAQTFEEIEQKYPFLKDAFQVWPKDALPIKALLQIAEEVDQLHYTKTEWKKFTNLFIQYTSLHEQGSTHRMELTPTTINELVIRLLQPSTTYYDGTIGLGTTAAAANDYHKGLQIYGQEHDLNTLCLAKLYLFLQDVEHFSIEHGDTLARPQFTENERLQTFDTVMMNFPFSLQLPSLDFIEQDHYKRFNLGRISKKSADYAFILHGLASMNEKGKAAFIVPNGVLFRGGMEAKIRQQLIASDVIEAVISLPENMFHYAGIQTNLLILNKNKRPALKEHIYFINAEELFETDQKHAVFTENHIKKIVSAYENCTEENGFSKKIHHDQLEGSNLLCQKYIVDTKIDDPLLGQLTILLEDFENLAQTTTLGEITTMYRGLNISSATFKEGEGPYKILKLSDVQDGQIIAEKLSSGKLLRESKVENYLLQEDDLVISNRGASIKIAVVPKTEEPILLSHNFIGLRLASTVDPIYLKQYLESPIGKFLLQQQQIGTAVLTINAKDLANVEVLLHPLEEQKHIANQFEQLHKQYEERRRQLEEFKAQETSALYKLMGIGAFWEGE